MGQKDLSERSLFELNDVFVDIVNGLVFAGNEVIKEDELEDLISLFGIENQTETDENMIFRILSYDGASYKNQISRADAIKKRLARIKNKTDEKTVKLRKSLENTLKSITNIYPVITLVLYYGEEKWKSPMSLRQSLNIPQELSHLIPDYKINVYNLKGLTDKELERLKGDFAILVDFLQNGDNLKLESASITHFPEMMDVFTAFTGDERFEETKRKMIDLYGERNVANMCNISEVLDKIENRGKEQGIKLGEEQGIRLGEERGRFESLSAAITKLMSNLKLTLEQALDAVGISEEEKPKYREMINKTENN